MATLHYERIDEVFVKMVGVFAEAILQRAADRDEIEEREVLHIFAQADAAGVWANGDSELGGHQQDRKDFIHASDAATINLTNADCSGLQELFEEDSVLAVLARSDLNRCNGFGNRCVTEDVVGAGRLFDEPRFEFGQLLHPGDRLADVPNLVGVHH